jgi:hypothetical protein
MAIRKITRDEFDDRLEWLQGAAGQELQRSGHSIVAVLDEVSRAAEQCAKHLREFGEGLGDDATS